MNRDRKEMAWKALDAARGDYNDWSRHDDLASAFRLAGIIGSYGEDNAADWFDIDIRDCLDTSIVWG